jgi:hypothetical protein
MKTKYLLLIGLFAATMVACSRDEESLFEESAAIRAQKAIENAQNVFTSQEAGWEMAYFPNLENTAKGFNMVLKFKKDGSVSVTAKNSTTTMNKIVTDSASTWQVKSDYGPILTFDTYNEVLHAWADPGGDGAGLLGDYEFLILKATPELVLLKGKKHSAYSVMRPIKNPDVAAYFAASEKMQKLLFGNNNIVTLTQGDKKMYLYNGASGQFMSAPYGSALNEAAATLHPVCSTEDGIVVSTGFGDDVHDHVFIFDSIKGELKSEKGAIMNAGNLNLLFGAYFTDNALGWAVDTTGIAAVGPFLAQLNTIAKDKSNGSKIKQMGYGYSQSLNFYEGGYFIAIQVGYKQNGKGKEQVVNMAWTIDLDVTENGITISNLTPYDEKPDDGKEGNAERWSKAAPEVLNIVDVLVGSFTAELGSNLFNATTGMKLVGTNQELLIKGVTTIKIK